MTSEVLQMLVHTETGELIPAGDESLPELAEKAGAILERHERDVWELGRIVSAARLRCEDPACGLEGDNSDARFGRWVSENFSDTSNVRSLYEARRLWEVFGQRRDEVAFIPQSGLYALAEPKCDDAREALLAELKASNLANKRDKIRVADVDEAIKRTVGHNHRALGTGENEWYTPDVYIEAAREVFGGLIALDPASSEIANQVAKAAPPGPVPVGGEIGPMEAPPAVPRPMAGLSNAPAHRRALEAPGRPWGGAVVVGTRQSNASSPSGERLGTEQSDLVRVPVTQLQRPAPHPRRLRPELAARPHCPAVGPMFPVPRLRDRCWSCRRDPQPGSW